MADEPKSDQEIKQILELLQLNIISKGEIANIYGIPVDQMCAAIGQSSICDALREITTNTTQSNPNARTEFPVLPPQGIPNANGDAFDAAAFRGIDLARLDPDRNVLEWASPESPTSKEELQDRIDKLYAELKVAYDTIAKQQEELKTLKDQRDSILHHPIFKRSLPKP
jgi:hypothetical protein